MNLIFVVYLLGTNKIELQDQAPSDVVVDKNTGLWHDGQGSYSLNTGVRVPEDREFFGTMMVLQRRSHQRLDLSRVKDAMTELNLEWAAGQPIFV